HKEPATTRWRPPVFSLSGDLIKRLPSSLQMLAVQPARLRFAPRWQAFYESRKRAFSVNRPLGAPGMFRGRVGKTEPRIIVDARQVQPVRHERRRAERAVAA